MIGVSPVRKASGQDVRPPRSVWPRVHPLVVILACAAILRLWGLFGEPVLYFDSGAYLGEGRFLASAMQRSVGALVSSSPGNPIERVALALQDGTAGHPPDLGKPGHAIFLALAILVLGNSSFAAGGAVSALAGLGTIAATYFLGSRGWNPRVGAAAAVLLAISGQHLVYSREPLVEADGLLFATLASLVYLRQVTRVDGGSIGGLLATGVLFGISFTCNNRLSYLALPLGLVELMVWQARGWRRWQLAIGRGVALGAGFAAPLAVIQLAYLGARALAHAAGVAPGFDDYVQQLANFWRMNPPSRLRLDQWPTYFVDVIWMDGWLVLALGLFGLGVIAARRRWSRADVLLLGSLLTPLLLYSVYSSGEVRMRNFSLSLPWLMLAASIGLWWLAERLRARVRVVAASAALAVLVVLALPRDIALVTAPNGMPALLSALHGEGTDDVASTNGPALSFLVGEEHTNARLRPAFINTLDDLRGLGQRYTYVEVGMQAYWSPGEVSDAFDRTPPVFTAANGNDTWYLAFLLESQGVAWNHWDVVLDEWQTYRQAASETRLFRIADVLGER